MEARSLRRLEQVARHVAPGRAADVCGIIAVVGGSAPAADYVLEGLAILQVRRVSSSPSPLCRG